MSALLPEALRKNVSLPFPAFRGHPYSLDFWHLLPFPMHVWILNSKILSQKFILESVQMSPVSQSGYDLPA